MRVVAVFSGGGAKALAHAGAFRALQQANLQPDYIVATSMGAVVGAALAAGAPFEDVRRRALSLRRKDIAPFNPLAMLTILAQSLFPAKALRRAIERLVPAKRFAHLKIPLTVTATDLDSGELVLCGEDLIRAEGVGAQHAAPLRLDLPLHDALYASCALPLYYPPLELNGRRLADGGLRAVLPLAAARAIAADLVVAVDVGPGFDEVTTPSNAPARIPGLVRAHGEAIRVMMAAQTEWAVAAWNGPRLVYVRAVAEREATFAVSKLEQYVEMGYQATKKALG